jgi:quercetin dioxygenase-like cupin family protein
VEASKIVSGQPLFGLDYMIVPFNTNGGYGVGRSFDRVKELRPDSKVLEGFTMTGGVSFSAGARTNWYAHPGGQILLITAGKGYYQEQGKPKRIHRVGDVVKCPPNMLHWHWATPEDSMVHIVISPNLEFGSVSWHEPVTDSIYLSH